MVRPGKEHSNVYRIRLLIIIISLANGRGAAEGSPDRRQRLNSNLSLSENTGARNHHEGRAILVQIFNTARLLAFYGQDKTVKKAQDSEELSRDDTSGGVLSSCACAGTYTTS
jgi:hypothetical protein